MHKYQIVALVDNDHLKWGERIYGYPVISPQELIQNEIEEYIVGVWSEENYNCIRKQLISEYAIKPHQIKKADEILNQMCQYVFETYKTSDDEEIRAVISYYKRNGLNIYGTYEGEHTKSIIMYDEANQPYIVFEGKRMFFPEDEVLENREREQYIYDIIYEQGEGSPHKYITADNKYALNGVIVDAGVREGNFALRYVEQAKKIYLIEADPNWMQVLKKTFAPYKDKIVFCEKYLSDYDSSETITLDTLVKEKIDFLKLDIEGAEVDALNGGKNILANSNAQCAICSYHTKDAQKQIETYFKELGYSTTTSKGYMYFPFEDVALEESGLRRGIVYAHK